MIDAVLQFYNGDRLPLMLKDAHPPARLLWSSKGAAREKPIEFWLDQDSVAAGAVVYREVAALPGGGG